MCFRRRLPFESIGPPRFPFSHSLIEAEITSAVSRYNRKVDRPQQVAIAGAGVVGLACALALRRRGLAVTLLEAGMSMREASWAAGGMLAVSDPENPLPLQPLSRYSRTLYDDFLAEIASLSGHSVRYRTRQALQLKSDQHRAAGSGRRLSHAEAVALAPGINPAAEGYEFCLLDEDSLDPRDLCAALPAAARARGIRIEEQTRVQACEWTERGVRLRTSRGEYEADAFLNCAGAWSSMLQPQLPVRPRKGQMLTVEQTEGTPLLCVLRSPDVYLIPRGDGRIAIGATVEDAGFSKTVEPDALEQLRGRAAALFPPVRNARIVESWAGLRPGSTDELPVLDRLGPRIFTATGHYRNGILLAPATAEIMGDLICGIEPAIDLAPFRLDRNAVQPSCDKQFAAAL